MDATQFDRLARSLVSTASRRGVARALAGSALAGALSTPSQDFLYTRGSHRWLMNPVNSATPACYANGSRSGKGWYCG